MKIEKVGAYKYIIPRTGSMRVDGVIFASDKLMQVIQADNSIQQVVNVATLPGIVEKSIAMPDIHYGYGFPIGGVAAFKFDNGIISPGGVGYDINCGVRTALTDLTKDDINEDIIQQLITQIYNQVPCGVGSRSKIKLNKERYRRYLLYGARQAVEEGYGEREDLEHIEEGGYFKSASPEDVPHRAYERGRDELGTLGAGNHFLEIQVVEKVYNPAIAERFGIFEGQIAVMIHTGSRGFGYQVCDEYIDRIRRDMGAELSELPDPELIYAPFHSHMGQEYFGAMSAAANYAFANRQIIYALVRKVFERVFASQFAKVNFRLLYDVAHNIAKVEEHEINGRMVKLIVHRKGATRAFPAGRQEIGIYSDIGQPVIIPGSMGTASYVLIGAEDSLKESFGTTCHGAGRVMSRHKAIKAMRGVDLIGKLRQQGVTVRSKSYRTLMEETPSAYKDIDEVVNVVHNLNIARKVARLIPVGVVKG